MMLRRKNHPLAPERLEALRRYLDEHLILESEALAEELEETVLYDAAATEKQPKGTKRKLAAARREDGAGESFSAPVANAAPMMAPPMMAQSLADLVNRPAESFSTMLLRLIDERGLTDPQVYKRAGLDRKHFSKIRSNPDYRPSKNTALALAVALGLDLDRTADLLGRAGYALSPASRFDLIVEYFIREGVYDIGEINEALYAFDENLLGG